MKLNKILTPNFDFLINLIQLIIIAKNLLNLLIYYFMNVID